MFIELPREKGIRIDYGVSSLHLTPYSDFPGSMSINLNLVAKLQKVDVKEGEIECKILVFHFVHGKTITLSFDPSAYNTYKLLLKDIEKYSK